MKQVSIVTLLFLFSAPAMAYVGPGLGMGVIGTIFGVLAAVVLALFGLFWYPLKRMFSKRKKPDADQPSSSTAVPEHEQAAHPDTLARQPLNLSNTHPVNKSADHPEGIGKSADPATSNLTDSQMR